MPEAIADESFPTSRESSEAQATRLLTMSSWGSRCFATRRNGDEGPLHLLTARRRPLSA